MRVSATSYAPFVEHPQCRCALPDTCGDCTHWGRRTAWGTLVGEALDCQDKHSGEAACESFLPKKPAKALPVWVCSPVQWDAATGFRCVEPGGVNDGCGTAVFEAKAGDTHGPWNKLLDWIVDFGVSRFLEHIADRKWLPRASFLLTTEGYRPLHLGDKVRTPDGSIEGVVSIQNGHVLVQCPEEPAPRQIKSAMLWRLRE